MRLPENDWKENRGPCPLYAPLALLLVVVAILANLPAMIRYVRTGEG